MHNTNQELTVGDMCLLDIPRWTNYWPQVAQVVAITAITGEQVQIRWYKGGKTGRQVPEVLVQAGVGRIDWEDTVNIKVIWFYGFKLTSTEGGT